MGSSNWTVTYRLEREPESDGMTVIARGPQTLGENLFSMRVSLHDGYSTLDSIPRIVAVNHRGRVNPEDVIILGILREL